MILVDTSIWADHFNRADAHLVMLNRARKTTIHPFVIGELAAGNLLPRDRAVAALRLFVQRLTSHPGSDPEPRETPSPEPNSATSPLPPDPGQSHS